MHPTIGYQTASALITGDHHRAERERTARAVIRATRPPQHGHRHPAPWRSAVTLTRHALTMMGARTT